MTTAHIILTDYGMHNAAALVAAAQATGVPLRLAAAVAQKESNGRNVYGNDTGGYYSTPNGPDIPVTKDNYAEFYRLVVEQGHKSNGVGPMQITYRGYFPQAREQGIELWVPFQNMVFGLRIIARNCKGDYSTASIERAGTLYNAGNLTGGITAYGRDLAVKTETWRQRFLDAGATYPRELRRGWTGPDVAAMQAGLLRRFPSYAGPIADAGGADGKFGPATEGVLREFQRRVKVTDDGVATVWTRGHLATHGIAW